MKIGVVMLGDQSPYSRGRGIGRYTSSLIRALIERDRASDYVLYYSRGLPWDHLQLARQPPRYYVKGPGSARNAAQDPTVQQIVDRNPHQLDVLLSTSPLDLFHFESAAPASAANGPRLCSIVYDLIPIVLFESYLWEARGGEQYYRLASRLREHHRLLAISEATRRDCMQLLGCQAQRVVTIGAAADCQRFYRSGQRQGAERRLAALGIRQPFVLSVVGMDPRKNLNGILDAFALLPEQQRHTHQLVLTCTMSESEMADLREHADAAGLAGQLLLTNYVPDASLRLLYQSCAAFVHVSHYEGFGLPILEAMQCGAPVVAGNNSSQTELVGDAGLLVQTHDAADIAQALNTVITDDRLAEQLRRRAQVRAEQFSWSKVADQAAQALHSAADQTEATSPAPRVRSVLRENHGFITRPAARVQRRARPRLAFFSPWPPLRSGISDYATQLLRELDRYYSVDLYHDHGYRPTIALTSFRPCLLQLPHLSAESPSTRLRCHALPDGQRQLPSLHL